MSRNFKLTTMLVLAFLCLSFLFPVCAKTNDSPLHYMGLDFESLGIDEEEQKDLLTDEEVADIMLEKGYGEEINGKGVTQEEFMEEAKRFPLFVDEGGQVVLWSSADPVVMDIVRVAGEDIPDKEDLDNGNLSLSINGQEVGAYVLYKGRYDASGFAGNGVPADQLHCALVCGADGQFCYCENPYRALPNADSWSATADHPHQTGDFWQIDEKQLSAEMEGQHAILLQKATTHYWGYGGQGYNERHEMNQISGGDFAQEYIGTMKVMQFLNNMNDPMAAAGVEATPAGSWLWHNVLNSEWPSRKQYTGILKTYVPIRTDYQGLISYTARVDISIEKPPEDDPVGILVYKTDNQGNNIPLAGATFRLWTAQSGGDCLGEETTDSNGQALFGSEKIHDGNSYWLEETTPPPGYKGDSGRKEVGVTGSKQDPAFENKYIVRYNAQDEPDGVSIQIHKYDGDSKDPIQGAKFVLYEAASAAEAENSSPIANATTGSDGMCFFDKNTVKLDASKTYWFQEDSVPSPYVVDKQLKKVTFGANESTKTFEVPNYKGLGIEIEKVDQNGDKIPADALKEARFVLRSSKDTSSDANILEQEFSLDENGFHAWNCPQEKANELLGKSVYLYEVKPPTGYKAVTEPWESEPLKSNGVARFKGDPMGRVVNETDGEGYLRGHKYNADDGSPLAGATFTLYRGSTPAKFSSGPKQGQEASVTTDANGDWVLGPVAIGEYTLKEKAPAGFAPMSPMTVTVEKGTETEAKAKEVKKDEKGIPNKPGQTYKLKVVKKYEHWVQEEGQEEHLDSSGTLPGIGFKLFSQDGDFGTGEVNEWTLENGEFVEDLLPGHYTIEEDLEGANRDHPPEPKLAENIEKGEKLAWTTEGSVSREFDLPPSGDDPNWHADMEGGTYVIEYVNKVSEHNVSVPHDYYLIKTDASDGHGLAGATFNIYGPNTDKDPAIRTGLTSGSDGKVRVPDLTDGTYYWEEVSPPSGYTIDNPGRHPFVVSETSADASVGSPLTVTDSKEMKHANLEVQKINAVNDGFGDREPVEGVEFWLWKGSEAIGDPVGTATTDDRGIATFTVDVPSFDEDVFYYTVKEVNAPTEWQLDDPHNPRTVEVRYGTPDGATISVGLTFYDHRIPEPVKIYKKDAKTKELLGLAQYRIGRLAANKTDYNGPEDLDLSFGQNGWVGPYSTTVTGEKNLVWPERLWPFEKEKSSGGAMRDGRRYYYVIEEWQAPPDYEVAWDPLLGYHSSEGGNMNWKWPDGGKTHDDVIRQVFTLEWGVDKEIEFQNYKLQDLDIMKVNFKGEEPIQGVVFELWATDDDYAYLPNNSDLVGRQDHPTVFDILLDGRTQTTDDQGRAHFSGLHVGEYRLVETKSNVSEAGHRYLGQWRVLVTHSGVQIEPIGADVPSTPAFQNYVDETSVWKIYNQTPPEVPLTGRIDSTAGFILAGATVLILAGIGVGIYLRRRSQSLK